MLALLLAFLLSGPAAAGTATRELPEGPIDVVIAIDSSLSLRRSDPRGFGREAARDLVDFLDPGDRIGVVRFAGWEETTKRGAIVFPISEIPEADSERQVFLDGYRTALEKGLGEFGRGTDFNVAFHEGVFRLFGGAEAMGSERPVWIILYTDGGMDVIEGEKVRERYRAEASLGSRTEREALNRAALSILQKEVVPHLEREKVIVTVLYPGDLRPEERVAPLPGEVPAGGGGRRERLLWVLDRMAASTSSEPVKDGATKVVAGAPLLHPFRVSQGVESSRIFVFGETTEFHCEILDPMGKPLVKGKRAQLLESGRLYRIYQVSSPEPGDYLLTVDSDSERPARFLARLDHKHNLALFVRRMEERATYHLGEQIPLVAGLQIASTGDPVTDPTLLARLQATIRVEDPKGNLERRDLPSTLTGPAVIDHPLPGSATPGRYKVRVEGGLAGVHEGDPMEPLAAVETEFSARGLISIEFSEERSFPGREVRIVGVTPVGSAPVEGALAVVSNEDASTQQEVRLVPGVGVLEGTVVLDQPGRWTLDGRASEWVDVTIGSRDSITVTKRRIEVHLLPPGASDFSGEEDSHITLVEGEDGTHVGNVGIVFDLLPGEEGSLSAAFLGGDGKEVGKVQLDRQDKVTLSGVATKRIFQVQARGDPVGGQIEFRANLVGIDVTGRAPVLWRSAGVAEDAPSRRNTAVLAFGASFALLALLGVIRFASIPRFKEQRLWHLGDNATTEHSLLELRKGFWGNRAVGTPEVPLSIELILKSRKQARLGRCLMRPLQKTDQIYVNHFAIAGPLELQDAAEIIVERDGFPNRYIYYAEEIREEPPGPTPVSSADVTSVDDSAMDEEETTLAGTDTDQIPRPEDETQVE